jgi:HTH-type transcriptional regulator / antitoxin HipB
MATGRESSRLDSALALGEAIRSRRKELRLTQSELAAAASTSLRFVSEVERGKPTARLDGVLRLLAALGLSLHLRPR